MNAYWEDKIPDFKKIRIPVYATASWQHFHLHGSFNMIRKIRSSKKWMRAHREQEWPDQYNPANIEDLRRFFDRYLKNINNGWELTPRYRIEVMDAYDCDYQTNRPEKEFPLARTVYKKLYLDASNGSLSWEPMEKEAQISYDSATEQVNFDIRFDEDTEITGYMWLRLWVEADGHDDMDSSSPSKSWMSRVIGFRPYSWRAASRHLGKLRVSMRDLDEKLTTNFEPVISGKKQQKLKKGEIVPVDIALVPTSWIYRAAARVEVAGRYIREGWF